MGLLDFFKKNKSQEKIEKGLEKTKKNLWTRLKEVFLTRKEIDTDLFDELEEALILSDISIETTIKLLKAVQQRIEKEGYREVWDLIHYLKDAAKSLFPPPVSPMLTSSELPKPYIILVVGVNGAGKTTTIGKLSHLFKQQGKTVLMIAGDTFRAAAVAQLEIWAQRTQTAIYQEGQGADPGAVVYKGIEKAKNENVDIVLIDTAGRLHNKSHLMRELEKIVRVIKKQIPEAPHEVLLVLDATTGQNAIQQATEFTKATQVTGIILTKLDGTAKGGIILSIADQFRIPVQYIGVGEKMDDLQPFDPDVFLDTLFEKAGIQQISS